MRANQINDFAYNLILTTVSHQLIFTHLISSDFFSRWFHRFEWHFFPLRFTCKVSVIHAFMSSWFPCIRSVNIRRVLNHMRTHFYLAAIHFHLHSFCSIEKSGTFLDFRLHIFPSYHFYFCRCVDVCECLDLAPSLFISICCFYIWNTVFLGRMNIYHLP